MRFPAYGRALMEARRGGLRPIAAHVIVSNKIERGMECDFLCGSAHPEVVLIASEFESGAIDWRCVRGLLVTVFDRLELQKLEADLFLSIVRDIALEAGPVWYWANELEGFYPLVGAHDLTSEVERVNSGRRKRWTTGAERELLERLPT